MAGIGWQELLIVLVIFLLIFGGTKLAGLGRASGKAIREFKEETEGLSSKKKDGTHDVDASLGQQASQTDAAEHNTGDSQPTTGETVDPSNKN